MDLKLKHKVVIVTGAGGAIGSATAIAFAREGARVVVSDYLQEGMDQTVQTIRDMGGEATGILCNVGNAESARNLIDETVARYGRLDVLVNNAGINGGAETRKRLNEYDDALWHRILSVDLDGVYYCSKYALTQMLGQEEKGNIVNIGSVAGVLPLRLQVGYVAAKAAVLNMTRAMAVEYAIDGIRVNCVCPGSIMTEGTKTLFYSDPIKAERMMEAIPMHRPGTPEDIASAVCMVASDAASGYVTGSILNVDGAWTSSIRSF